MNERDKAALAAGFALLSLELSAAVFFLREIATAVSG